MVLFSFSKLGHLRKDGYPHPAYRSVENAVEASKYFQKVFNKCPIVYKCPKCGYFHIRFGTKK